MFFFLSYAHPSEKLITEAYSIVSCMPRGPNSHFASLPSDGNIPSKKLKINKKPRKHLQVSGSTPDLGSWKVINAHFTYREVEAFEKTLSLATVHATDEGQYENSTAAVFSLGHRVLPSSPL